MQQLLFVTSSLFGEASKSRLIGTEFVQAWRQAHPGTTLVERVLTAEHMPHLSLAALQGGATPAIERTPAQAAAAALADTLIAEVEAADVIVLAAPMYNFSIASTLKAWLDHIARAGRTFRYTAAGPEGLLRGKRVFVASARGGFYGTGTPTAALDFQEPYLRAMLAFLGLTDVTFVHAEGLAINPETAARGLQAAREALAGLLPPAAAQRAA
jgi:FMN-dependent NADH-azoreductase